MIALGDDTAVECLTDGSLITWLRVPGDETSRAAAFVRHEQGHGPHCYDEAGCTPECGLVVWLSGLGPRGGYSIREAEINYPAHVIVLGGADWLGNNTLNDPAEMASDPYPQLTPPEGESCSLGSLPRLTEPPDGYPGTRQSWYDRQIPVYAVPEMSEIRGGTWAREKALECAARVWANVLGVRPTQVTSWAEEFEKWLDRPADTDEAPTLGAMAQVLTRWREAGVTLESLHYVVKHQVWADGAVEDLAENSVLANRIEELLAEISTLVSADSTVARALDERIDSDALNAYITWLRR